MCILRGSRAKTFLCFSETEILECAEEEKPSLITVDAPLNLPPGRKSIDDRNDEHYRLCDLELRKRKIPFFPITLGPMRLLTVRGIELRGKLEDRGFCVVEMYPGGAQDIWKIPRARRDLPGLRRGLQRLGIKGLKKDISNHELDAATGAFVGLLFLQEKAEVFGNFAEGAILMPKTVR
jgi:predicted nuclease with RNAse H fold